MGLFFREPMDNLLNLRLKIEIKVHFLIKSKVIYIRFWTRIFFEYYNLPTFLFLFSNKNI